MSYGPDLRESFERVAAMADRILTGAKPADLPFERPTHYLFVVKLQNRSVLNFRQRYLPSPTRSSNKRAIAATPKSACGSEMDQAPRADDVLFKGKTGSERCTIKPTRLTRIPYCAALFAEIGNAPSDP